MGQNAGKCPVKAIITITSGPALSSCMAAIQLANQCDFLQAAANATYPPRGQAANSTQDNDSESSESAKETSGTTALGRWVNECTGQIGQAKRSHPPRTDIIQRPNSFFWSWSASLRASSLLLLLLVQPQYRKPRDIPLLLLLTPYKE